METCPLVQISATQVCQVLRRNATNTSMPEGKLWMEVLVCAIKDRRCGSEMHRRSAKAFFESHHFVRVCDFCGLDPTYAREMIESIGSYVELRGVA